MGLGCCASGGVGPGEEVLSTTTALRFTDETGDEAVSQSVVKAVLIRNLACKTEAAVLVFGQTGCFGERLVAAVPICLNIRLQLGFGSTLSADSEEVSEAGLPTVVLELSDVDPSSLATKPLLEEPTKGAGYATPADGGKEDSSFAQRFYALRDTAARHRYKFPSQHGNHAWLWSYGPKHLPVALRDAHPIHDEDGDEQRPSLVFGGTHIRMLVGQQAIPWVELQPKLRHHELEYCAKVPLRVVTVSLNCAGNLPPTEEGYLRWLFKNRGLRTISADSGTASQSFATSMFGGGFERSQSKSVDSDGFAAGLHLDTPDIVFVALQETTPLVAAVDPTDTAAGKNQRAWREAITSAVKQCGEYVLFATEAMVGLLLLAFAMDTRMESISNVSTGLVRCGTLGGGNKGAVAAGFKFLSTTICFVNAHLASGDKDRNPADREEDYNQILNNLSLQRLGSSAPRKSFRSSQQGNGTLASGMPREDTSVEGSFNLFEYDAVIWAGDFNARLWKDSGMKAPLERSETFAAATSGKSLQDFMSEHDELHIQRARGSRYQVFREAPVNFMPTYKLKPIAPSAKPEVAHPLNEVYLFDSKREPAYCDRILWRAKGEMSVTPHEYERVSAIAFSDHRPVRLGLTVVARSIDVERLRDLCAQFAMRQASGRVFRAHDSILDLSAIDDGPAPGAGFCGKSGSSCSVQ